jgi:hypothetical protein
MVLALPGGAPLDVGATRPAADGPRERGALVGVARVAFAELAMKLALPALAQQDLSPGAG